MTNLISKVKNRTDYPVLLYSSNGESVQINPHAIASVEDRFLIDFDRMKIQILNKPKISISEQAHSISEAGPLAAEEINLSQESSKKAK